MPRTALAHALNATAAWGRAVLDFLYPPVCPLCYQGLTREDHTICFRCERDLVMRNDWRCVRCGATHAGAQPEPGNPCRLCPPEGSAWRGALSVTGYGERAARCVHLFKYQRREEIGETMARLMVAGLEDPMARLSERVDVVAPVPLHWARRLMRGFNQSEILAEPLAKAYGIKYAPRLLRRVKYTKRQALIPRERRAQNVANAFALTEGSKVEDQGILIVDDVVTSGETINECAKVLRDAGAREVWVASFARAGMGRPQEQE